MNEINFNKVAWDMPEKAEGVYALQKGDLYFDEVINWLNTGKNRWGDGIRGTIKNHPVTTKRLEGCRGTEIYDVIAVWFHDLKAVNYTFRPHYMFEV